jgi:hypothetical protein
MGSILHCYSVAVKSYPFCEPIWVECFLPEPFNDLGILFENEAEESNYIAFLSHHHWLPQGPNSILFQTLRIVSLVSFNFCFQCATTYEEWELISSDCCYSPLRAGSIDDTNVRWSGSCVGYGL